MSIYFVPENPSTPLLSLSRLRARAKRAGYRLQSDHFRPTFSLIDDRLGAPIADLDHVGLGEIADALDVALTRERAAKWRRRQARNGADK